MFFGLLIGALVVVLNTFFYDVSDSTGIMLRQAVTMENCGECTDE